MPNLGQMIRAYLLLRRAGKLGLCLSESRRHRENRLKAQKRVYHWPSLRLAEGDHSRRGLAWE
jgi:hypothetical protein